MTKFEMPSEIESLETLMPFGKYKGKRVFDLKNDPEYLKWLTSTPWFQLAMEVSRQPWFADLRG